MSRSARALALTLTFLFLAAACTGGGAPKRSIAPRQPGGTLRVGSSGIDSAWDTQQWGQAPAHKEIERCCLTRTLLSYNGRTTAEGGTALRPDIAAGLPVISSDGMTWTFRLKRGLHYAPPLQHTQIVAQDFVRAMDRDLSANPPYLCKPCDFGPTLGESGEALGQLIAGAAAYTEGKSHTVSGLEAPDAYTLKIHLNEPTGELGYYFALPETAPIPAKPRYPEAKFGVATGHEGDYGYFQAASGPYMIEGADTIDFALPAVDQSVPSGIRAKSVTLIRNPSWDPATDHLRTASVDHIVVTKVPNIGDLDTTRADANATVEAVHTGDLDTVMSVLDMSQSVWQRYERTPDLRGRAFSTPQDFQQDLSMNLAMPPLDDPHVRKAINYAIDKAALLRTFEETTGRSATLATHIALDSQEENLLLNYDPYGTPSHTGDLERAKREMALSNYDTNGDGICDAAACSGIRMLVLNEDPDRVAVAPLIRTELRTIGLGLKLDLVDADHWIQVTFDPGPSKVAINLFGFTKVLPSAQELLETFRSDAISSGLDASLLGATPVQLRGWGYPVSTVPNVDARIDACVPQLFRTRTRCWADLDQYLMEEVVPSVPLYSEQTGRITSDRVASFSFDQANEFPMPALDRFILTPAARRETPSPEPSVSPTPPIGAPIPDGSYTFPGTDGQTLTITLSDGHWRMTQVPPFDTPVSGIYYGTGDSVTFVTQLPEADAGTNPRVSWTSDGRALRFKVLSCAGFGRSDCEFFKAFYEAHPWTKTG